MISRKKEEELPHFSPGNTEENHENPQPRDAVCWQDRNWRTDFTAKLVIFSNRILNVRYIYPTHLKRRVSSVWMCVYIVIRIGSSDGLWPR